MKWEYGDWSREAWDAWKAERDADNAAAAAAEPAADAPVVVSLVAGLDSLGRPAEWQAWNDQHAGAASSTAAAAGASSGDSGGVTPAGTPVIIVAPEPTMDVEEDVPGTSATVHVHVVPPAVPENVARTLLDILVEIWEETHGFRDLSDADVDH